MVEDLQIERNLKKTDVGLIPNDWALEPFTEIATLKHGFQFLEEHFSNSGIGVIKIGNLKNSGGLDLSDLTFVPYGNLKRFERFVLSKGDVLMALTGATLGKVSKVYTSEILLQNYRVGNFIPNSKAIKDYIYHISQSSIVQRVVRDLVNSGAQPNLGKKDFDKILIPLPPTKEEQTAIATALNDTDKLISQLEKLIAKKQLIKQGAMQELLRPKEGWEVKRLGEVANIFRGGSPRPIEDYLTLDVDGINWIKIGDVDSNAKYIYSTEERIIPQGAKYSREVKEGDFLLSNSMSFGRPYILKTKGCIHDGWLVIQNYQNTFNTDFLYYLLGFETTLNQYKTLAAGSTVLNLNKEIVNKVNVRFPNLDEQIRIAQILSDMDSEIHEHNRKLDKYKMTKQGMMQNLLTGKIRLL